MDRAPAPFDRNSDERAEERAHERAHERALLVALGAGDRRAAEAWVERTYSRVYAALFRLTGGDTELAADLTQETYRKAWEALPSFRGGASSSTWLYRIAYTTFLNHTRRPRLMVAIADEHSAALQDPQPSSEEVLAGRESRDRIRRAVLDLGDDARFTLTAHYWGELAPAEIARLVGVTPVAIRKRLRRALAALDAALRSPRPPHPIAPQSMQETEK